MKILYVITSLSGGGAEKVVCNLADAMCKKGHDVQIVYLTGNIVVQPSSEKIKISYLKLRGLFDTLSAFRSFKDIISFFQPDIVHAHMIHANIFTRLSRLFVSIPRLICSAHSKNEGGKLRMLAYRLTHNLCDVTTNVSQEASTHFVDCKATPQDEIITIYNGIDLKSFSKKNNSHLAESISDLDRNSKIFIAVGRFHEAKDYPNLINAYYSFQKDEEYSSYLLIVGDGDISLINQVKNIINQYALSEKVLLLGRRNDIKELLNLADFFVLSSKYEGLPTVVIEAMACGTFVIATDCGGSTEIMGDTGILVPPQNSEALAQALKKALNKNPLEIEENNLKARQRVEELFSLEKSVENWLKIYRNE